MRQGVGFEHELTVGFTACYVCVGFAYGCNGEDLLLLPALDSSSSSDGLSAEDSRPVYGC